MLTHSRTHSGFHCRRFLDESDTQRYREFLVESLDIECPTQYRAASEGFYQLQLVAFVLVGVWPAGCLFSLGLLLWAIRGRVVKRSPSKLSYAARVLTRDYTTSFFWWEWVKLLRQLLLTGFVLGVPESAAFLRLVAAVLFSVVFFVTQTVLKPFKDDRLQVFSLGLQSVVILLFLGGTYMYAYEKFAAAIANSGATISWQEGGGSHQCPMFLCLRRSTTWRSSASSSWLCSRWRSSCSRFA